MPVDFSSARYWASPRDSGGSFGQAQSGRFPMEVEMNDSELRAYGEAVKEAAGGRWVQILGALAPQLGDGLEMLKHAHPKHVPCPVHGGKDGFRFFRDAKRDTAETGVSICNTCGQHADGWATLMWANYWDFSTAFKAVAEYLGMKRNTGGYEVNLPPRPEKVVDLAAQAAENEKLRLSLNRVWCQSISISDQFAEPARLYLARRGISVSAPETLRFHKSLSYYDENGKVGDYPALVAMVSDPEGKPVTIHRTFLTKDGKKAPVECPKKLMKYPSDKTLTGAAIRLTGDVNSTVIAVCEGLETSLAVIEGMPNVPVWCTVNATLLAGFIPPASVEQILVFSDKDRATVQHPRGHGQEAATQLVQRLWEKGIKASAIVPAGAIQEGQKSLDWLDILNRDGMAGFPSIQSVEQALRKVA